MESRTKAALITEAQAWALSENAEGMGLVVIYVATDDDGTHTRTQCFGPVDADDDDRAAVFVSAIAALWADLNDGQGVQDQDIAEGLLKLMGSHITTT